MSCRVTTRLGPRRVGAGQHGDGDIVGVFPLYEEDVNWLLSNVVAPPIGSSTVVRANLFVRSCLVVNTSLVVYES